MNRGSWQTAPGLSHSTQIKRIRQKKNREIVAKKIGKISSTTYYKRACRRHNRLDSSRGKRQGMHAG